MFICNHCPYVKHVMHAFGPLERDYASAGLEVVAINANDVDRYPEDSPEKMRALAHELKWGFPYLLDELQSVARAFRAACTPDFYLFDEDGVLAYRGQFDGSRPGNDAPVTGADLRGAIDAVLGGRTVSSDQTPSIGCNIKWKPGHEPDYFHG
jgi:thiol-disulfide isomerase/thioredoxin